MEILDPGHDYLLSSFDGGDAVRLTFVKRNDPPEKYPGNVDAHSGTQTQEVLRALIDRGEYVNKQLPCRQTEEALAMLAQALWLFEQRHVERHGQPDAMNEIDYEAVALMPFCLVCGHINCFCQEADHDNQA